jgi:hypothetical protein
MDVNFRLEANANADGDGRVREEEVLVIVALSARIDASLDQNGDCIL